LVEIFRIKIENQMKKLYHIYTVVFVAVIAFCSCNDGVLKGADGTPPGQITNVEFTPLNGGGFFTYTIPSDEDFLYVRAEYTIDNGETISKTNSVYSDTLFISGLGSVKEYAVNLYSVNRTNNRSQPVVVRITPLEPTAVAVLETVTVMPGFSSLVIDWDNPQRQTLTILATVTIGSREATLVHASNTLRDRFTIPNLSGVPHEIKIRIRDMYGNETERISFGEMTPLMDGAISKKQWSFLRDNLLFGDKWDYTEALPQNQRPLPAYEHLWRADSMRNARETHYEGRIEKFWDNMYDYAPALNLNYFHTGSQSFPFSYFIDMGRLIVASRLKVWQRDWSEQLYLSENVRTFEIWISDDNDPTDGIFDGWEYVGRYTIVRPSDPIVARNEARNGHEFMLYPDNPRFTKPFRYLRFKAVEQAGDPNNPNSGCLSEITLFGTEADGSIINDPETLVGAIPGWES
jgi:hypothetical protein